MTRREEEKKKSLADLARIADKAAAMPWLDGPSKPAAAPPRPASAPRSPPSSPSRSPSPDAQAERARAKRLEERRLKLEEEKALKARRARELAKGKSLDWRGMDNMNVPASIRRTAFDRAEPSLQQKLADILGESKKKDSREKARAKGKRQGGR